MKDTIKEIVQDHLKIDVNVNLDQEGLNLDQDLGLDSLDVVEVIIELEKEFDIVIPDEEAFSIKTLDELVDLVQKIKDDE